VVKIDENEASKKKSAIVNDFDRPQYESNELNRVKQRKKEYFSIMPPAEKKSGFSVFTSERQMIYV